jgi:hypothetical protein
MRSEDRDHDCCLWARWPVKFLGLLMLLLFGPIGILAFGDLDLNTPWHLTS